MEAVKRFAYYLKLMYQEVRRIVIISFCIEI